MPTTEEVEAHRQLRVAISGDFVRHVPSVQGGQSGWPATLTSVNFRPEKH